MDLVVGQTYTRSEVNTAMGFPEDCECRIMAFDDNGRHICATDELPPTRENGYYGRTLNCGQLVTWLSTFPPDMPVTIACPVDENNSDATHYTFPDWMNIVEVSDPRETGEFSVILIATNDFDTRQW